MPPSRHRRDLREAFRNELVTVVRDPIPERVYKVRLRYFGHYYKKDGTPTERDTDSQTIPLLDELARALGWKSDKWLQRGLVIDEPVESLVEFVEVELT